MAAYGDSYSRLVGWLKIVLPLSALGILSTLFLMSRTVDSSLSIPLADPEIRELANRPRISNPAFRGVSDNGSVINLSAEVALPLADNQPGLTVHGIVAAFESPDGRTVTIEAATGTVDSTSQKAELGGGVSLNTSFGYLIQTEAIVADMDAAIISTTGPVVASGPLGSITAGRMTLQQASGGDPDTYELSFQNGVKLVYEPNKSQE